MALSVRYKASKTTREFHKDDSFVRAIMGPVGSGKSVACIQELVRRATRQEAFNGIRRTRWVIVRNTYRELLDTTMQTFFDWVPKEVGNYSALNSKFTMRVRLQDGTIMESEFMFRALDRPNDVKKLLSLEVTGGFVNEAREVPKQVIDMLQSRCGRFPSARDGGPTWFGVILDTNPPDSDHWWYTMFEEVKPEGTRLFHQPGGLEANAENVENLPRNYYRNMMAGKDQEWINVYVHGLYGFIADGKPVFPEYKDSIHSSDEVYVVDKRQPIYIGIDFGLTPAAVFGQITPSGRMVIFDELCTFDMGAMSFGRLLKEKMERSYKGCSFEIFADPAGEQRAQTDEQTPFMILQNQGIFAIPTYTNDFTIRREACADYMMRLDFAGNPAFMVSHQAKTLRKSLSGGYKYKRMQVTGEAKFMDKPDKGKYSHVADAMQYLFLGAVGGVRVIGGYSSGDIDYSVSSMGIV
jgi:Phage terminase large subunit